MGTTWKSIKNYIINWCQKSCCILFGAIYRENKQWHGLLLMYNLFLACIQTRIYLRGISTSRPFRRNNASTMTDLVATPRESRPPLASVRGHTQPAVRHGKAVANVRMRLEHLVTRVTTFWTPCSSLEAIPITRPAQNWCGRSLAHSHQAPLHW